MKKTKMHRFMEFAELYSALFVGMYIALGWGWMIFFSIVVYLIFSAAKDTLLEQHHFRLFKRLSSPSGPTRYNDGVIIDVEIISETSYQR